MHRKPYNDPRPARVRTFASRLAEDAELANVDLAELASVLPLWQVSKTREQGTGRALYAVWLPEHRNASVPWALPPTPSIVLDRAGLIDLLRERWLGDAAAFLSAAEHGG